VVILVGPPTGIFKISLKLQKWQGHIASSTPTEFVPVVPVKIPVGKLHVHTVVCLYLILGDARRVHTYVGIRLDSIP
jgi:hypothetical protein